MSGLLSIVWQGFGRLLPSCSYRKGQAKPQWQAPSSYLNTGESWMCLAKKEKLILLHLYTHHLIILALKHKTSSGFPRLNSLNSTDLSYSLEQTDQVVPLLLQTGTMLWVLRPPRATAGSHTASRLPKPERNEPRTGSDTRLWLRNVPRRCCGVRRQTPLLQVAHDTASSVTQAPSAWGSQHWLPCQWKHLASLQRLGLLPVTDITHQINGRWPEAMTHFS